MYLWIVQKVARFYVDVITFGAAMHHDDMNRLKKEMRKEQGAQEKDPNLDRSRAK